MNIYAKYLCCFSLLLLCACTVTPTELDTQQHAELVEADQEKLKTYDPESGQVALSLEEALKRGGEVNLDARVAALEALAADGQVDLARINAYPSLSLAANYIGRSNEGAASSRSILSGTESLEPSFSTEQYRMAGDLSLNWSILNIMLAVSQTQNAKTQQKIAAERYNKVLQNIQKDIYAAYYRALVAQKTQDMTGKLLDKAEEQLQNLAQAQNRGLLSKEAVYRQKQQLQEAVSSLRELQGQISLSDLELKSLLSYPQETHLKLTETSISPLDLDIESLLAEDISILEIEALQQRPEVRESILQQNISRQNIREELIRTVPGANLFLALNRDSNQFLQESQWANFTLSVEQNLAAILSYPTRRKAAKNEKELEEARRLSLTLAIMTQVHLARQRLDFFRNLSQDRKKEYEYQQSMSYAAYKKAELGFETKQDALLNEIQAQIKKINYYQLLAEFQDAYATMNNTLARDLLIKP